jgi:dihydroneopterin aldolase / 2-amino-4-hydroxy-6-hydroxymethyldihydropteridine diphosphokinase
VEISIEGLEVYAYHGVLPEEKTLGQPFVFDLTLSLAECAGCRSDRVEDTIDYTEVIDLVTEIATGESYDLLERLAYEVGSRVAERFPVLGSVHVRVRKPRPPIPCALQSVGVSLQLGAGEGAPSGRAARAYLGLGSNEGDPRAHLRRVVQALERLPGTSVEDVSSVYRTAPVGPVQDQADFFNLVLGLRTRYSPAQLLAACQAFEAGAGRTREVVGGPRPLDLDLLWYEGVESFSPELELPHPRLEERRFVLEPLAEIAPGFVLPSGRRVEDALAALGDQRVERAAEGSTG